MKRHITLLLSVLLVALALVGCSGHQHTYSDEWQKDETNHWHASTCTEGDDCKAAKASVALHTDADGNKACDVCGYDYGHTHTYAEELTGDETGHFKAPTCGCTIEGAEKKSHTDADFDGVCDGCGYTGGHEHTLTGNWAMDAKQHWKEVDCAHFAKPEAEDHDFNDVGLCETCGYVKGDTITVGTAVGIGAFYDTNVKGGSVIYSKDEGYGTVSISDAAYSLGTNALKIIGTESWGEEYSRYFVLTGDDVFVVQDNELGEMFRPDGTFSVDSVKGYFFKDEFTFDDSSAYNFYGVTNLVKGLYALAEKSGAMTEMIVNADGETVYTFNFSAILGMYPVTYYDITVAFTLGDRYTYKTVSVSYEGYPVENQGTDEAPEYVVTSLLPNSSYNYVIEQEEGDRDYTPKYTPEGLLMTDFKLADYAGNEYVDGDVIEASAGSSINFTIVPVAPETADSAFDFATVGGAEELYPYNWKCEFISISAPSTVGEYEFTVKTIASEVKTFTLKVIPVALEYLDPLVDGMYCYTTPEFTLKDGSVSVEVTAEGNYGAPYDCVATLPEGTVGATMDGFIFTATAAGEYVITLTDKATGIFCEQTIIVKEPVAFDLNAIFSGTYKVTFFGKVIYTLTFTPDVNDAASGTVTVVDTNGPDGIFTGDYAYYYENGTVTYTPATPMTEELPFYFNSADNTFSWNNVSTFTVTHEAEGEGGEEPVARPADGYYAAINMMSGNPMYYVTINGDTVTVEGINNTDYDGVYTLSGTEYVSAMGGAISFTDYYGDGSAWDINFPMYQTYPLEPATPPVEPGPGEGEDFGDVEAIIQAPFNGWFDTSTGTGFFWDGEDYNWSHNDYTEQAYIGITVDGANLTFVLPTGYNGILVGATAVYDGTNIVITLADSSTITLKNMG